VEHFIVVFYSVYWKAQILREKRVVLMSLITVSEKYTNSFETLGAVYPTTQRNIPRTLWTLSNTAVIT